MTEGLIAVRRNLTPGAVFFRQRGTTIQYSLDKVTWFFAWELNTTTNNTNGNIDLLRDIDRLIDKYSRKYYRDLDFSTLINLDVTVMTRVDAIAKPPERAYNPLRLCYALKFFLDQMRTIGLGIQNGGIETDDIDRFSDTLLNWVYGNNAGKYPEGTMLSLSYKAAVASFEIWDAVLFFFAQTTWQWTDEQIDDYVCCLYDLIDTGEFNYSEFVAAGESCSIGAWDEIATPQNYAMLVSLVAYGDLPTDKCPCEDCLLYVPTDGLIKSGQVAENTLITSDYVVSGNYRRMGCRVEFTIPNMILTDVQILIGCNTYENGADAAVPRIQFISPGTSGGFVDIATGLRWYQIPPSIYPGVPTNKVEFIVESSSCASCTTNQLAIYNTSFASIVFVSVCGILQ